MGKIVGRVLEAWAVPSCWAPFWANRFFDSEISGERSAPQTRFWGRARALVPAAPRRQQNK